MNRRNVLKCGAALTVGAILPQLALGEEELAFGQRQDGIKWVEIPLLDEHEECFITKTYVFDIPNPKILQVVVGKKLSSSEEIWLSINCMATSKKFLSRQDGRTQAKKDVERIILDSKQSLIDASRKCRQEEGLPDHKHFYYFCSPITITSYADVLVDAKIRFGMVAFS